MRLLFLLLIFGCSALAEDARVTALVAQSDTEERHHRTRPALSALRAAEQVEPNNLGVLLRMSRQYSDLVDQTKPADAAKAVALKSLDYAQRASKLDPTNAKARLSVAVAYGKLTDFAGNKTKLEYSRLIRDEAAKAIELDPSDDFAWHVLGRWHFGVANVNGVMKGMASLIYGGLPDASNEEAARHLRKAAELAPRRIIHHSELARVYQKLGKPALAKTEWKIVLSLPASNEEDRKDQREATKTLGTGTVSGKQ